MELTSLANPHRLKCIPVLHGQLREWVNAQNAPDADVLTTDDIVKRLDSICIEVQILARVGHASALMVRRTGSRVEIVNRGSVVAAIELAPVPEAWHRQHGPYKNRTEN